jgi:ATP-binding cassette subfamily F protein uup
VSTSGLSFDDQKALNKVERDIKQLEQQKKELTLSFENPNLSAEDLLKKSKDLEEVIKNLALLEEKWLALMM